MIIRLEPQPGPQTMFLSTSADIAIYGGAAGGGKTFALLMETARHSNNKDFGAVVFRRTSTQITTEGGLWDTALSIFSPMGVWQRSTPSHEITFKSGATITFAHLQYEKNVYDWQGSQIPLVCFDELTHFTKKQFFYMMSRNRSMCGVRPYIRASCNPDPDSWVAEFIAWWIDQDTGYPIPERSGKIRWFGRLNDEVVWADTPEQLFALYGIPRDKAKSVTFIASSIYDNKKLLETDPSYLANLEVLDNVEKERLLFGNWKIRPAAGLYFKRTHVDIVKFVPGKLVSLCRAWDLAATEKIESNDPDRTGGVIIGKLQDGSFIVLNAIRDCWSAADVRKIVKNTAVSDRAAYSNVRIRLAQDPGQAGKEQAQSYIKMLAGFNVTTKAITGSKVTRATPFASQWQGGNVHVLYGDWNDMYFKELEGFPDTKHDDLVDASSDAFNELNAGSYNISALSRG